MEQYRIEQYYQNRAEQNRFDHNRVEYIRTEHKEWNRSEEKKIEYNSALPEQKIIDDNLFIQKGLWPWHHKQTIYVFTQYISIMFYKEQRQNQQKQRQRQLQTG